MRKCIALLIGLISSEKLLKLIIVIFEQLAIDQKVRINGYFSLSPYNRVHIYINIIVIMAIFFSLIQYNC